MTRTNEEWLNDLNATGKAYEEALADLRKILLQGLQRGLMGRINTSAPGFQHMAEDFVQEALLKILDNLHTFAGRSKFTTWAHKVSASVALTELRRKRWQDRSLEGITDTDTGVYTPSFLADKSPKPDNVAERAEVVAKVQQLIDEALTEKQRKALVASTIQGLSAAEIARDMDMKPNAVYKLVHDARVKLKKTLSEDGLSTGEVLAIFE